MDADRGVVLYDFMLVRGGAEKLTLTLLDHLAAADLVYGFRDQAAFPDALMAHYRHVDLGARSTIPGWRSLKVMHAFRRNCGFIRDYDWALFSGTDAPLAVDHRPAGRNYYYCHTIPRFAYDLRDYYRARTPPYLRPALDALAAYVRHCYAPAIARMDRVIANSENVRRRLKHYLGVDATVVNPPIETERFRWLGEGDYYLSLARLEPFKRVDLLVDAFLAMPERRLVVASGGSQLEALKARAAGAPNIRFTGWTSDAEMAELIGHAIATLYIPVDEDFGMSPVESMAAGKPVIGVAEGGLLETVLPDQTGILIASPPTVESVIDAVARLPRERARAMREACERQARRFSRRIFLDAMQAQLDIGIQPGTPDHDGGPAAG